MGNAPLGSGWLYSSDEETPVLLRLNDVRNIYPRPGEEVFGVVSLGPHLPHVARVTQESPAMFAIDRHSALTVEVRSAPRKEDGGRSTLLGKVRLPLAHLAERCGRSVYHTWFPLQMPSRGGSDAAAPQQLPDLSQCESVDQLDRILRAVVRDPRFPMVSLSLCPADAPEASTLTDGDRYPQGLPRNEKAQRFTALEYSLSQHARLLQSLYRQSRSAQHAAKQDKSAQVLRGALAKEDPLLQSGDNIKNLLMESSFDFTGASEVDPNADAPGNRSREIARLHNDIETTTAEANLRINQASDAIRTLKERLTTRQAEHERLRQESIRLRHDADTLAVENENLRLQLERRSRERATPDEREQELRHLRRQADMLREQKDTLVLILQELSGTGGKGAGEATPQALAAAEGPLGGEAASPFGQATAPASGVLGASAQEEPWTNMLPRPSELYAGGVLGAG